MSEAKDSPELPLKPSGPLLNAAFAGGIGVLMGALWSRILHKPGRHDNIPWAGLLGGFGLVSGYAEGVRKVTEHALTVENIQLKHQLAELQTKPLAQQVSEETPACGCKGRS